jgi:FG-GAP-like repeat/FG-GAP repeat
MSVQCGLWDSFLPAVLAAILSSGTTPTRAAQPLFAPAPDSPIGVVGGPGNVDLGDLDGDGKLDLVVACGKGKTVTVLLGRGDGRFRAARGSPIRLSEAPGDMAFGDLNGDGKPDLAVAHHDSYGVTLLFGDGRGGLAPAANSPVVMKEGRHPHTHGLNSGDLNGDGKPDLVAVNSNPDNVVSVVLGDGRGGFTRAPGSPFAVGPSPYPGALGDLNGDGRLDIVATTTDPAAGGKGEPAANREFTVLFGDGRGGFRRGRVPLRTPRPWFVAVADVTGDRKPDLVATHAEESSKLTVLLGDGKGTFAEATGSPFDLGHAAWHVAVLDADRDGKADVVAAAHVGVRVMLGDGKGGFKPAPGSPFPAGKGAWRLAVGDVNGDGKPDVATSNLESDSVSVLLGQ